MSLTTSISSLRKEFLSGNGLRARSLWGTGLVTSAFGLQKILQLGSNLILTRILFPEAFGLMALVSVFITGLSLLSDVGIQASLVRSHRSHEARFQSTAWTLQAVRGLWIAGLACLLAWPYAQLYDQPLLFPLICVSSLAAGVSGFKSVQTAIQQRQIILGRVVTLQLLSQAVSISLTVLMAWLMQSVWGLAIGNVMGAVAMTLLSHVLLPSPNHRFVWDRSVLSEIVGFGRWILLGTVFTYLGGKGLQMIQGYLVDIETVGFLHIAAMFAWLLGDLTSKILGSVGFPALSQVARERPQDVRRIATKVRTIQTAMTTPGFILLALVAQPMIGLLYDDRYAAAGVYLSLMALGSALGSLPMVYQSAMLAVGDSRVHATVMALSSALKIACTVIGFHLGGVIWMILGNGFANVLVLGFAMAMAARRGFAGPLVDIVNLCAILAAYAVVLTFLV